MTIDKEKVKTLLRELLTEGDSILLAEQYRKLSDQHEGFNKETLRKIQEIEKKYPLMSCYQSWYSRALPFVSQIAPERSEEFSELYKFGKRKELDVTTYGIFDYLQGITTTCGLETRDYFSTFSSKFQIQIGIIKSLGDRIDSVLANITGVLQSELFDGEIEVSEELLKKKHLRASGAVTGVVLESHLKKICVVHGVTIKKRSTLADFNESLKSQGVIELKTFRFIQYLTDIRNLCVHSKEREPKVEDIQKLIDGTKEIIKTVY